MAMQNMNFMRIWIIMMDLANLHYKLLRISQIQIVFDNRREIIIINIQILVSIGMFLLINNS